ncbi:MAG: phospholipid carrier-dependent glycosyltransferase, partial [Vulcanimicrobiaceae bacterium]
AATWAFVAAALLLFNPAAIYVSAYWGQVDSVAALFVLLAIWLLVRTDACAGRRALLAMAAAWLAIAYSILIKPPATVLVPLLLAYALAAPDPLVRRSRVRGTLAGVAAGFGLAYLAALAFHPGWNPLDQFAWLWHRYAYASNVYPYNSVNAFNLQAVWHRFWESDATIQPGWVIAGRTIGLPEYLWGIVLVVAAGAMVIARYVSRPTRTAFLEAAMLLSLGFFVLATRMHERYVFDAFVLVMPLVFVGRRYLIAAIVLTITLLGNLVYSLDYLHVMDQHLAGVDPTNLMPLLSKPLALANVVLYFVLGYRYIVEPGGERPVADADFGAFVDSAVARVRPWFAPGEGLATMTRVDYAIASGLTLVSFAIMFVNYWLPAEKIFDEIYYARAGAEYLKHIEIYEFTHPPLTKLIVALSMLLFGGLAHGDTSA